MIQTITVKIELKEGQEPYSPVTTGGYHELDYFFGDAGYRVESIDSRLVKE